MADPAPQSAAPHTPLPLAVFALLLGIYLLTTGGHTYAVDEEQMYSAAQSLALRGSFAIGSEPGGAPIYSVYGPGQSVAALPLYALGRAAAAAFPADAAPWVLRMAISWFNPLVTAAVAALVAWTAALLGMPGRPAAGAALLYGLGTMAWPHSKTFFAEPLTALLLFGSFALLVRRRVAGARSPAWLLAAGVVAGLAATVKVQAGFALPLLALYLAGTAAAGAAPGRWRRAAAEVLVWSLGAAASLALLGLYQWALFGSPLRTGYGQSIWLSFSHDLWDGLAGQLWSFGRGIIWYAPPTLLGLLGLPRLWRRHPAEALLCALMAAAHLLFYARWVAWEGAGAWGPRFLNVALPFVMLGAAAFLAPVGGRRSWRSAALAAAVLLALPAQAAGLAINMNSFFAESRGRASSNYRLGDSAIVGHLRIAVDQLRQAYDIYAAPDSAALVQGFSYSEGGAAQLPRWTTPRAEVELRSSAAGVILVRLTVSGCWAPGGDAAVALRAGAGSAQLASTCPARRAALLLPGRRQRLTIEAPAWDPRASGVDRPGPLGVVLEDLAARAGDHALTVRGELTPIPPLPTRSPSMRRWAERFGQWDVWWLLLPRAGLPAAPTAALMAVWLGVAICSAVWGGARVAALWRSSAPR